MAAPIASWPIQSICKNLIRFTCGPLSVCFLTVLCKSDVLMCVLFATQRYSLSLPIYYFFFIIFKHEYASQAVKLWHHKTDFNEMWTSTYVPGYLLHK